MWLKDEVAKEYIGQPEIFADLFNQYCFQGEQVIRPERLRREDPTEGVIPESRKKPIQQQRDLLKFFEVTMTDGDTEYWLLGVENQSAIHYAMPVRHALVDSIRFKTQVDHIAEHNRKAGLANKNFTSGFLKEDLLKPVITVVLYLGQKPWDGAISLHEMCRCSDKRILNYVMDYRLNLISPLMIKDEEFKQFRTTLGKIMPAIKYASDKKRLTEILLNDPGFLQQIGKTERNMLDVYAGIKIPEAKEGETTMNWAFEEILADKKAEGRAEERDEMIRNMLTEKLPLEMIARISGKSLEYVQTLL